MEISGIDKIHTINKMASKEAVQAAKLEDTLSISSEAQKKVEWVEKLKQMPDIRPEKIETALSQTARNLTAVAQKIANSGF